MRPFRTRQAQHTGRRPAKRRNRLGERALGEVQAAQVPPDGARDPGPPEGRQVAAAEPMDRGAPEVPPQRVGVFGRDDAVAAAREILTAALLFMHVTIAGNDPKLFLFVVVAKFDDSTLIRFMKIKNGEYTLIIYK